MEIPTARNWHYIQNKNQHCATEISAIMGYFESDHDMIEIQLPFLLWRAK